MLSHQRKGSGVAAAFILGVTGAGCTNAPATRPPFMFREAEFLPPAEAGKLAEEFVTERLPAGLQMREARARIAQAGMTCSDFTGKSASVLCRYAMVVHIEGGVIGEDAWTIRLLPREDGTIKSATVEHSTVGVGQPGPS